MFRAVILPIFRNTRLCVTACGIMHPRYCRPATCWVHYTTRSNTRSSVLEDGQKNCPKHVELTGIINKPLLLHLVGCLYYLYFFIFFLRLAKQSQFIPLQNVVYFITLRFLNFSFMSLLFYHTCLYILGTPDDGWMWRPKHVEQDDKWIKHLNCCIKLVFYSFIRYVFWFVKYSHFT